jgi:hypothetical protein
MKQVRKQDIMFKSLLKNLYMVFIYSSEIYKKSLLIS